MGLIGQKGVNILLTNNDKINYMNRLFSHSRCTPLKKYFYQKYPRVDDDTQLQVMIIIIDHFNLHALEIFLYTKIIPVHILCSY